MQVCIDSKELFLKFVEFIIGKRVEIQHVFLYFRANRKWMYDKIEIEGNDFVIRNDYKHKQ